MKTAAAGRGFEPVTQDATLAPHPQGYRCRGPPVLYWSQSFIFRLTLNTKGRSHAGHVTLGMKTDMAGQGVEPQTTDHGRNTSSTRLSLPRRAATFFKLVFDPALIARYGRAELS